MDSEKNPNVEVRRDDLLWAVNTLAWDGHDGEIVERLSAAVSASEPEGGRFAP